MHRELTEAVEFHQAIVAEAGKALVGYEREKALANVVLMSEIPTTYDKDEQRQVNAGNLLLRGVPGIGKTFFGVIIAAISDAKFARIQGRADSAADRGRRVPDDEPRDRGVHHGVRAPGVGGSHPARRDQPDSAEIAKRVSRRAAGSQDHGRQDDLRPADVQFCDCHDEPRRAGPGDVPAFGGRNGSLRDHGQHRIPAARGRARLVNFDFKQVRLNALMSKERIVQLRGAITREVFLHEKLGSTLGASSAPHVPTTWKRIGSSGRRPISSSSMSILGRRRARPSAGGASCKVWAVLVHGRDEVYPEDVQELGKDVLSHRIWLGPHATSHGITPEQVIDDIIAKVRDSMSAQTAQPDLVDFADINEIELRVLRRMKEYTLGDHGSVFHGTGVDFVGLRDWQAGDRLSAMTGLNPRSRISIRWSSAITNSPARHRSSWWPINPPRRGAV